MKKCARQQVYQLCQQKDKVEVLELNAQPNHVHVVMSMALKYAVPDMMIYLKMKLAMRLF